MSRNAPIMDDVGEVPAAASAPPVRRRPGARLQRRTWDVTTVGILTPLVAVGLFAAVLGLSQIVYPDPDPPVYPTLTPISTRPTDDKLPTPVSTPVIAQAIDLARLNAGVLDKPPIVMEWPEVEDLKLVPSPGRPNEQADYVPAIADIDRRRLVSASTVTVIMHQTPGQAKAAVEELAKAYPLREGKRRVIDLDAYGGYLPDESIYGVVVAYASHRVQVETVIGLPNLAAQQREEVEYHTLHLADHIIRRLQEVVTSGRRTGPEAQAVHWRDHLTRRLPFGRP